MSTSGNTDVLCKKCNGGLNYEHGRSRYVVYVEPCEACLKAEHSEGHFEGYTEREGEIWQDDGMHFNVKKEDMIALAMAIATGLYNALERSIPSAVFIDTIDREVKRVFDAHFKAYKGGEDGIFNTQKKA